MLVCQRVAQKEILNPDKELVAEEPVVEAVGAGLHHWGGDGPFPQAPSRPQLHEPTRPKGKLKSAVPADPLSWLLPPPMSGVCLTALCSFRTSGLTPASESPQMVLAHTGRVGQQ